jgi:two-component system, chemotaxis family, chemotaxis protein CheY
MRALIVDDSRTMRQFLGQIVARMGYTILEAGNGIEALTVMQGCTDLQVALIDIDMPEMNGMELLDAVRKDSLWAELRIMMVSSHSTQEAVHTALLAGAQEYLMKPLTREMLEDKFRVLGLYE